MCGRKVDRLYITVRAYTARIVELSALIRLLIVHLVCVHRARLERSSSALSCQLYDGPAKRPYSKSKLSTPAKCGALSLLSVERIECVCVCVCFSTGRNRK